MNPNRNIWETVNVIKVIEDLLVIKYNDYFTSKKIYNTVLVDKYSNLIVPIETPRT